MVILNLKYNCLFDTLATFINEASIFWNSSIKIFQVYNQVHSEYLIDSMKIIDELTYHD